MSDNGGTPPETVICGRCASACDAEDNFCRHCGLALRDQHLPAVQDRRNLPALAPPALPAAVVRGATVVAVGALAEFVLRRMVTGLFRRRPKSERRPERAKGALAPQDAVLPEGTALESETLLLRRVRIRR